MAGFDPISAALDIGGKLIDRFFPDPAKKAEALLKLQEMQANGELARIAGQLDVNKVEAASSSIFVAGWRPFIGWICGASLGYQFFLRPLLNFVVAIWQHGFIAPSVETAQLFELLIGMLGLAGYRTYEKVNGVDAGH